MAFSSLAMACDIHPKQSGHGKMANTWFTDLTGAANVGAKCIGMRQYL